MTGHHFTSKKMQLNRHEQSTEKTLFSTQLSNTRVNITRTNDLIK